MADSYSASYGYYVAGINHPLSYEDAKTYFVDTGMDLLEAERYLRDIRSNSKNVMRRPALQLSPLSTRISRVFC